MLDLLNKKNMVNGLKGKELDGYQRNNNQKINNKENNNNYQ